MTDIYDYLAAFISKWWLTFLFAGVLTSMVLGSLSVISAYAIFIVLILTTILKQLKRIAETLEAKK